MQLSEELCDALCDAVNLIYTGDLYDFTGYYWQSQPHPTLPNTYYFFTNHIIPNASNHYTITHNTQNNTFTAQPTSL